jgi:hypothetical protein
LRSLSRELYCAAMLSIIVDNGDLACLQLCENFHRNDCRGRIRSTRCGRVRQYAPSSRLAIGAVSTPIFDRVFHSMALLDWRAEPANPVFPHPARASTNSPTR